MSRSARSLQDITVANHIMYYNTRLLHDERVITSRLMQVIFVTVQTHTHTHSHGGRQNRPCYMTEQVKPQQSLRSVSPVLVMNGADVCWDLDATF